MKTRIIWVPIVTILIFLLVTTGLTFQNEPEGFRELKWGDPPTDKMIYKLTSNENKIYFLPDDKMSVGNAQFWTIAYFFYNQPERFYNVSLYFKGENTFELLKTICRGKFGKETESGFYELKWLGQKAMVGLCYDMVKELGYLFLTSTQIAAEKKKIKEKEEIERAEKDW